MALNIIKTNGNLGRQAPSEDAYSGLCMNGVDVIGGASLNTVYELNNLNDAEALGLNKAYDLANDVLVWHRIREFFRLAPNGKLFIILVAQSVTLTQMALKSTTNGLAKLLRDPKCAGLIRQAAIARNPASGYTPTDGDSSFDGDVLTVTSGPAYSGAIINAQALAAEEETLKRPVTIFVEGRGFNGTTAAAIDLHLLSSGQVATTIAQDADVAALDALFGGYAAVECLLGMAARRAVNESVGWVADGNLQDQAEGIFIRPALSSGSLLSAYSDVPNGDFDTLESKGYIFPKTETGYPGVFFNKGYTCVLETDDYARIELNRTMQKAIRITRVTLTPEINRSIPVDATSGKMTPGICQYFEEKVENALDLMLQNVEISGKSVFVDPNQNVISTSVVTVRISIVPTATAETITAYIGFSNPFN